MKKRLTIWIMIFASFLVVSCGDKVTNNYVNPPKDQNENSANDISLASSGIMTIRNIQSHLDRSTSNPILVAYNGNAWTGESNVATMNSDGSVTINLASLGFPDGDNRFNLRSSDQFGTIWMSMSSFSKADQDMFFRQAIINNNSSWSLAVNKSGSVYSMVAPGKVLSN